MKRGLVKFDPSETPVDCFEQRLAHLQDDLKRNNCSMGLIYSDVSRSGDVNYLTNFCLYWNEAVLAVPTEGRPALIMKLSKRVQPWIKRTTVLDNIYSGPRVAENIGKFLDEATGTRESRIGIVDMSWWPGILIDQLKETIPDAVFEDLPGLVRAQRLVPGQEELSLLQQATVALDNSIETAWSSASTPHDRISTAVRESRKAGFVDAEITSDTLSDGSSYITAKGQYRYVWISLSSTRGGPMAEALQGTLDYIIKGIRAGVSEADMMPWVKERTGGRYQFVFSCMSHTDIETGGSFRPEDENTRPLQSGEVVCLSLTFYNEGGICTASDMLLVNNNSAKALKDSK